MYKLMMMINKKIKFCKNMQNETQKRRKIIETVGEILKIRNFSPLIFLSVFFSQYIKNL